MTDALGGLGNTTTTVPVAHRWSVGSLFAGIGGIDLGLERTGYFRTAWVCERDPYCQRVLAKHWPNVPLYEDVADICDDTLAVDVIAGGFPCQPVSHAGRRKAQEDERWLWPHVERTVRILRPRGVLLENVPGLLSAGIDDVIGGLAACGYDAEWDCIPAAAVGAPHRRDRVFIVATRQSVADSDVVLWNRRPGPGAVKAGGEQPADRSGPSWPSPMAYAERCRQRQPGQSGGPKYSEESGTGKVDRPVNDGIWPAEPNVGRVANGIPNRVDRLRALGNAVVPQVAEYVGHQLARKMRAQA